MSGPFGPNGIKARTTELAAEGFQAVERLQGVMEEVLEELRQAAHDDDTEQIASRTVAVQANGTDAPVLRIEPKGDARWTVEAIVCRADSGADRLVQLDLDSTDRPLGAFSTIAASAGIGGTVSPIPPFHLPAGALIRATFPAATPAGTTCILHVLVRELAPNAD